MCRLEKVLHGSGSRGCGIDQSESLTKSRGRAAATMATRNPGCTQLCPSHRRKLFIFHELHSFGLLAGGWYQAHGRANLFPIPWPFRAPPPPGIVLVRPSCKGSQLYTEPVGQLACVNVCVQSKLRICPTILDTARLSRLRRGHLCRTLQ